MVTTGSIIPEIRKPLSLSSTAESFGQKKRELTDVSDVLCTVNLCGHRHMSSRMLWNETQSD